MYQQSSDDFFCRDKYYGRKLKPTEVPIVLCQFLRDRDSIRYWLIDSIVNRLVELHKILSEKNTYRFYASSLLIMYEGDFTTSELNEEKRQAIKQGVNIRLVDFAHSTFQGFRNDSTKHNGPDHGLILGLENLIDMFRNVQQN